MTVLVLDDQLSVTDAQQLGSRFAVCMRQEQEAWTGACVSVGSLGAGEVDLSVSYLPDGGDLSIWLVDYQSEPGKDIALISGIGAPPESEQVTFTLDLTAEIDLAAVGDAHVAETAATMVIEAN